jgi:hypothetical protein
MASAPERARQFVLYDPKVALKMYPAVAAGVGGLPSLGAGAAVGNSKEIQVVLLVASEHASGLGLGPRDNIV